MSRLISIVALVALGCVACGGDTPQTPASPSSSGVSSATQSAKIIGNVSAGEPLAAMAAQVVGTAISTPVGAGGGFSLDGVPAGPVQLRFVGSGVDASVGLNPVQAGDVVSVLVGVSGATATIQSESRNAGNKVELEGRVESLPPAQAAGTLIVDGRTVKTTAQTTYRDGNDATKTFADLALGQRVHVKGTLVAGPPSSIEADSILIQNTNTWIPVNVNGIVAELGKTAPSAGFDFTFQIGSQLIQVDANTTVFGDGDTPFELSDIKDGQRVEVKGELRNGFVYAVRIHINGPTTPQPPQDDSASVEGVVTDASNLTAGYPTLYLETKFGTTRVTTTSATVVQRRGSVVDFKALAVGQTVHAVGTRVNDAYKTLEAKFLQIKDDEAGGLFVIEGSMGGVKGTCPAISFGVNGYSVFSTAPSGADPGTRFVPDLPTTCDSLKSGTKVLVEGERQSDGSIKALTVTKK